MTSLEHSPNPETTSCVLLVDDNNQVRQMLSVALLLAGFNVLEASTQLEAQSHLARTRPDAVVLDLQHPETDGLGLLTLVRARQALRDVPIVFLAGSSGDELRWHALSAGADWFAVRPVGMFELSSHVKELIRDGRPAAPDESLTLPPTPIRRLKATG